MAKKENKAKGVLKEFKAFIMRGNVIDMAVGVIVGGAFGAIITALINGILMPLITAAIPDGGVNGLVTVLNHNAALVDPTSFEGTIVYYWGNAYDASKVNVINWGAVINAIIYFLAVALILFIVLKTYTFLKKKRDTLLAKIQEEYYVKHPDERPVPPEPGKPEPTTNELLTSILDEIKKK